MKTKVRDTSLEAYNEIKSELGKKQLEVLLAIREREPCNNRTIAKYLNWEINRVTGRVNELNLEGLIQAGAKIMDYDTGRSTWAWTLTEKGVNKVEGQISLF